MLRIVPHSVPRVSRSCEFFLDGFDLHLLQQTVTKYTTWTLKPLRPKPQKAGGSKGRVNKLARSSHEMHPVINGIDPEEYESDTEIHETDTEIHEVDAAMYGIALEIYESVTEIYDTRKGWGKQRGRQQTGAVDLRNGP